MAKLLRYLALFLVLGPLSAMLAEPFYNEVLDRLGWNTEDLAGPFMTALFDLFASHWFQLAGAASVGVGVGVWAHFAASRFDRSRRKQSLLRGLQEIQSAGIYLSTRPIQSDGDFETWRSFVKDWHNRKNSFAEANLPPKYANKLRFISIEAPRTFDLRFNDQHNRDINVIRACLAELDQIMSEYH